MKYIITAFSIIFTLGVSNGQSFEGKLTFKVDFNVDEERIGKMGISKEMLLNKMKRDGEYYDKITYFIKKGNYVRKDNSKKNLRFVYKSDQNLIYLFEENSEYVTIMKGENPSSINFDLDKSKIEIVKFDSIKVIQNDTCKLVRLRWGDLATEDYWYNPLRINIDSELFKRHNYEYLNKVLTMTNSFPLEITKSVGKLLNITMTIEKIESIDLDATIFEIPELKNSKREEDKYIEKITGNKVMRIK